MRYRDIDKEKQMLSILIKSKRIAKTDILNKLDAASFSTIASQELFKIIKGYNEKYLAPLNKEILLSLLADLPASLKHRVKGLIKNIVRLAISPKTVEFLLEQLLFFEACRDIQNILISAKDVFKKYKNPYTVKEYLMDMITQSQLRTQSEVEVIDFRENWRLRYNAIKKLIKSGIINRGIESGIDERFDDETSGYCEGDLHIFVAQPAGGKSLCMQDQTIYQAIEKDKKIAYVTNEMTPTQVAFRMDSRITAIRHRKFKKPSLMRKIDLIKWKVTIRELSVDRIKILGMTGNNCTAAAINAKLKEIGFKPDIIYIDYLNNMQPNSQQSGNRVRDVASALDWQPQGMIMREVKNLALSRRIPVIGAGQLKPEAHDKEEITPNDIAINKQALMQNADGVFAIIQTKAMKMQNPPRARIQFLKIREGRTRDFIEIIPDFSIIRINNPRLKHIKRKKSKKHFKGERE